MNEAEKFIEDEMPAVHRAALPKALKTAYDAVDLTISETPYLKTPSARMTARGNLLPYAVDYALQGLIDSGKWPFAYEYDFFARPTGKHLKILTANAVVTVSQLQAEDLKPRKATFRDNYCFENQGLFAFEKDALAKFIDAKRKKHLILGHGYQDLTFIQIGLPRPDGDGYLARTGNILQSIHDASADLAPVEEVTEEVIQLKKQLKKKIAQNGD